MRLILPKSLKSEPQQQHHGHSNSQHPQHVYEEESASGSVSTRNLQPPVYASPPTGNRNSTRTYTVNKEAFVCPICGKAFCKGFPLKRHLKTVHTITKTYYCDVEGCTYTKGFKRFDALDRHKDNEHGSAKVTCPNCRESIRKDGLKDHMSTKICRENTGDLLAGNVRPSGSGSQSLGPSFSYIEIGSNSEAIISEFSKDDSNAAQAKEKANKEHATCVEEVHTFAVTEHNTHYPIFQGKDRFLSLQELLNSRLHTSCEEGDAKRTYFYLSLIRYTGLKVAFADAFATAISHGHLETARIILDEVESDINTDENQMIQRRCCDHHWRAAAQYDMLCDYCDRYQHAAEQNEMLCKLNLPYNAQTINSLLDKPSIPEADSVDDPQTRWLISESAVAVKDILDARNLSNWNGILGEKILFGIASSAASRNGEIFQHLLHAGARIAAIGRHEWSASTPEVCDRANIRTASQFVSLAASLDSNAIELILNTGASLYRIQLKSAHANGHEHMDLLDMSNYDLLSATFSSSSGGCWFDGLIG